VRRRSAGIQRCGIAQQAMHLLVGGFRRDGQYHFPFPGVEFGKRFFSSKWRDLFHFTSYLLFVICYQG